MRFTMTEALRLWRRGNDAGRGFAPEEGVTVEAAAAALQLAGWTLLMARANDGEVSVLEDETGETVAIGDSSGAWAVTISEEP